jgi:hypothetical protein
MPFHQTGALRYITLDLFDQHGLRHGFFTRQGGVSPAPWTSLNHGGTTGDARSNVIENRRRMFEVFDLPVESIYDSWQVHGREVICASLPRLLDAPHEKADAILTNQKAITLVMRFADCVPVLLYDPQQGVTGIAHAGWQGTVQRTAAVAVERMQAVYGSRPADILAGIGPSICAEHYEVGPEVAAAVHQTFGSNADAVLVRPNGAAKNGATHLDLWKANQIILEESGVRQIEQVGICTACQVEDWYSHRAEKGKTGRYGVLLSARTM